MDKESEQLLLATVAALGSIIVSMVIYFFFLYH